MYTREQIEKVRAAIDIADVIRDFVPSLKAAGQSMKGLCPFHHERTPSFHVHPDKGFFKCFGCGEGGDAISFISKMEGVSFTEALEMLAGRAGVALERQRGAERREGPSESARDRLFAVLEAAGRFYEEQFWNERSGAEVRAYLEERGLTEETARRFGLGFAPASGGTAFESLMKRGYPIEICQQAGLVVRSQAGRFYDPMRGRLVFPIFDSFGHPVGFGGRVLPAGKKTFLATDDDEQGDPPKYLNSPDTPVFSKGKLLYGLNQAKPAVLEARSVVILEGYMDVIGVHQGGFPRAVATLGTAMTRDHAKLLRRYAEQAICFFDADEAGRRAAMRGLEPLVQEGFIPRVVLTDETADPDELIRDKGLAFLEKLVDGAPDFVEYVVRMANVTPASPLAERAQVAMQLAQLIQQSPNEIYRDEWLAKAAGLLGVARDSLERQGERRRYSETPAPKAPKPSQVARQVPTAEAEYLILLLSYPEKFRELNAASELFSDPREKRLFDLMGRQLAETGRLSVPDLATALPEADRAWFWSLTEPMVVDEPVQREMRLADDMRWKRQVERRKVLGMKVAAGTATADEKAEWTELARLKGVARATHRPGPSDAENNKQVNP